MKKPDLVSCEDCQKMHDPSSDDLFMSEDGYFYCYDPCGEAYRCSCGTPKAVDDCGEVAASCVDCLQAQAEARLEGDR